MVSAEPAAAHVSDLMGEWIRMRRKVEDNEFRADSLRATGQIAIRPGRDFGVFAPLWDGVVPQLLKDEDIPAVHEFAERLHRLSQAEMGALLGYTYKASCSAPALLTSLFSDEGEKTTQIVSRLPVVVGR